ncbi:hypothetical protein MAR_000713 [Mya arenaria]|uniref:Uncharacterized protein n=1 Tax=Mya arenaria TaxID=6604 RepID=A0ABY7F9M4_MYAAR|nr:hypothetical protein MAR_000713 [Mya arenaria]
MWVSKMDTNMSWGTNVNSLTKPAGLPPLGEHGQPEVITLLTTYRRRLATRRLLTLDFGSDVALLAGHPGAGGRCPLGSPA